MRAIFGRHGQCRRDEREHEAGTELAKLANEPILFLAMGCGFFGLVINAELLRLG